MFGQEGEGGGGGGRKRRGRGGGGGEEGEGRRKSELYPILLNGGAIVPKTIDCLSSKSRGTKSPQKLQKMFRPNILALARAPWLDSKRVLIQ